MDPTPLGPSQTTDLSSAPQSDGRDNGGGPNAQQADNLTKPIDSPAPVSASKVATPSKLATAQNGHAKPGIAAAIAAFEKGTIEKAGSVNQPGPPARKPTNPTLTSNPKSPPTNKQTTTTRVTATTAPAARKDPSPPNKKVELPPPDAPAAVATKVQTSTTRAVAPATTTASLKAGPRPSVINRTSVSGTAAKISARDNASSAIAARVTSPPVGTTAGSLARRTSVATTATKAPAKATAPAPTVTRKLTNHAAGGSGAKSTGTTSTTASKRTPVGPMGATRPNSGSRQAATAAELESKLSQAMSDLAEKSQLLAALEGKLEEATKNAVVIEDKLSAEVQSLNDKLEQAANASQVQVADTAGALEAAASELASARSQIAEFKETIELHQQNQAQLSSQQVESLAQVSQLEQSVNALKKALEEAHAAKDAAIAELSAQHSQGLESKLSETRQAFEDEKRALETRLSEAEVRSKQIEIDSATKLETTLGEELAKKTEEISRRHAEELDQLVTKHASRIDDLTSQHEAALKSLRETLQGELAEAREQLASSQAALASSAAELKEQHATDLVAAITDAQSTAQQAHEADVSSLKEAHVAALAQLEESVSEIKQAKATLEEERDRLTSEIEILKAEKLDLEERLSQEVEALKVEHAGKIEQEYQRAKDELGEAHIEQLRTFRQNSQEAIDQLQSSHKAELEAVKAALQSDFASEKVSLTAELAQLKNERSALQSDLLATRTNNQDQLDSIGRLTAELEKLQASLADADAKSKQLVDSSELESLRKALREAQEDASDGKAALMNAQKGMVAEFEHARARHESETAQHIERSTALEQELAKLKAKMNEDADRMEWNQGLVDELGKTIEQETAKREAVEAELSQLKSQATDGSGSADQKKLTELHEAHNAKIAEKTGRIIELEGFNEELTIRCQESDKEKAELKAEAEKWKDIAAKSQETAEEMEDKCRLLEEIVDRKDQKHADEADYEADTTVDQSSPLNSTHDKQHPNLDQINQTIEVASAQI